MDNKILKRVYSDRLIRWTYHLMLYFLLVFFILRGRSEPEDSFISIALTILMASGILFIIIRLILVLTNKTSAESGRKKIIDIINDNLSYVRIIGYVLLLGIIVAPNSKAIWTIYGIAAFAFVGFVVALISTAKGKNPLL